MKNKKSLRVGYLSPGWPLSNYPNGIVAYIVNILSGLSPDIQANILTSNINQADMTDMIVKLNKHQPKYFNYPSRIFGKILPKLACNNPELLNYKKALRESAYSIRHALAELKEPLDILEMEESYGHNYYLLNKVKPRLITRLHGPWFIMEKLHNLEATEQSKLRIFYEGEAIKNADGVTSPSLDVLEKVRDYYNVELPNAKVIPNPASLVHKGAQWKLHDENPYILFVGRFDSTKGGDSIIDAFHIIGQSDKNVTLYIVGPDQGVVVDGKRLNINEYITKNIPNESIRKRIKFYGHCDSSQILEMRQKAKVTVCCSRYENHSISLLEALSAGCPTVATAVGGNKEIIIDGYNGFLAEPESPESIAEKVLTLLNDERKLALFSKNAIDDTVKRFSPKDIAAQSVDYYQSVLNK